MDNVLVNTVISGVFFGAWPLLMNRSKLSGNASAVVFCIGCLAIVLPFAIKNYSAGSLSIANWKFAIVAVTIAGIGLLTFTTMVAKAKPETVSTYFVLNLILQAATPAIYQVIVTRNLTMTRGVGFIAAILAAALLTR